MRSWQNYVLNFSWYLGPPSLNLASQFACVQAKQLDKGESEKNFHKSRSPSVNTYYGLLMQ